MWVESQVARGSSFYFTISSQISQSGLEGSLFKLSSFSKRTILFVDTLRDPSGVVERIQELGLTPFVVHSVSEVARKDRCPHIDTIIVDSIQTVYFPWQTIASSIIDYIAADRTYTRVRAPTLYPYRDTCPNSSPHES